MPVLTYQEMIGRLALAILFGAMIGAEREWRDRDAGFRTHVAVCLGAAIFTLVSAYGFHDWVDFVLKRHDGPPTIVSDPGRISAQIVSGIGFLGAGAIMRSGMSIRGLTTAATLWVTASIGMAVGVGQIALGTSATVAMLIVLIVLRPLREKIPGISGEYTRWQINFRASLQDMHKITEYLQKEGHIIRLESEEVSPQALQVQVALETSKFGAHNLHKSLQEMNADKIRLVQEQARH